jgi:hypothetical protein
MAEFDFDAFLELAIRDPAAFDEARRDLLQQAMEETSDPEFFMSFQCALDMMRIGTADHTQTLRQMNGMSDDLVSKLTLLTGQLEKQLGELLRNLKQISLQEQSCSPEISVIDQANFR